MKKLTVAWPWLAAITSGLLYTGCFAPFNFTWLCWIAVTPLIAAVWFSGKESRHRWLHNLLLGYVTGLTFFWTAFFLLTTVTVLGWFVLLHYIYNRAHFDACCQHACCAPAFSPGAHICSDCKRAHFLNSCHSGFATYKAAPSCRSAIKCASKSKVRSAVYAQDFRSIPALERNCVALKSSTRFVDLAGKLHARPGSRRPGKLSIRYGPGRVGGERHSPGHDRRRARRRLQRSAPCFRGWRASEGLSKDASGPFWRICPGPAQGTTARANCWRPAAW